MRYFDISEWAQNALHWIIGNLEFGTLFVFRHRGLQTLHQNIVWFIFLAKLRFKQLNTILLDQPPAGNQPDQQNRKREIFKMQM